jgi:8-oxo-dGTP pyrophosphatase MutT (NUDIX family)
MVEPVDLGPREAALREAYEEIGLRAEDIHVLGTLDSLLTVTQFHITPVVATVPWPYPFQINPAEVASVFSIPLDWLSNPAHLEVRQRPPLAPGPPVSVYYFRPYDGEVIWGATARITLQLLQEVAALSEGGGQRRSV